MIGFQPGKSACEQKAKCVSLVSLWWPFIWTRDAKLLATVLLCQGQIEDFLSKLSRKRDKKRRLRLRVALCDVFCIGKGCDGDVAICATLETSHCIL